LEPIKHLKGRLDDLTRAARALLGEMGTYPSAAQAAVFDRYMDEAERVEVLLQLRRDGGESPTVQWGRDHIALDTWIRKGDDGRGVRNTLSTSTGSQGGYTVSPLVAHDFVDIMKGYGFMRQVATEFTTLSGADMSIPTSDGTAEVGERMAQNAAATSSDPSFGTVPVNATKYGSKVITVPFELLQDSAIDMVAYVMQRARSRIGRLQNQDYTTGTGTAQPTGLVTASSVGKTGLTGQTTTIIFDDLADMIDSVDEGCLGMPSKQPGVASRDGVGWMFGQTMRKTIRKLKDTNGRPIWLPAAGGDLPQLLDYPVFINNDMPAPAANAKSLAFGRLASYTIRDVAEFTLYRYTDSAYVTKGQVGFMGVARSGGNLTDSGAVKLYVHSAT
jgi:HK97 family phage major capsid protein